jgi:hypothetical protein
MDEENKFPQVSAYNKALEELLTPEELEVINDMRANVQIKEAADFVATPLFEPLTSYEMPDALTRAKDIRSRLQEMQKCNAPLHLLPGRMEEFFHLDPDNRRSPSLVFCDYLKASGNIASACALLKKNYPRIKITPKVVDDYRQLVPVFSESIDLALELFNAKLEEAAVERAVEGVDEPVFYQGEECGYKKKYSDDLLKFLMTANNPSKYGKADAKSNGSPIVVQIANFVQSDDYAGDNNILTGPTEEIIEIENFKEESNDTNAESTDE